MKGKIPLPGYAKDGLGLITVSRNAAPEHSKSEAFELRHFLMPSGDDEDHRAFPAFEPNLAVNQLNSMIMKTRILFTGLISLAGALTSNAQNASYYSNNAPINGMNCAGFGDGALRNNTGTDANNTALGWSALFNNSGGQDNTASGTEALYNNTSGSFNSAFGRYALYNNVIGSSNTAHGHLALFE